MLSNNATCVSANGNAYSVGDSMNRAPRPQRTTVRFVSRFAYGTGSDYANGILGHDDIIKMAPFLIQERPLTS